MTIEEQALYSAAWFRWEKHEDIERISTKWVIEFYASSKAFTDAELIEYAKEKGMELPVPQWQPIDTAPEVENGPALLSDGYTVGEAFWHNGSKCYGHRGQAGWFWETDRENILTARNAIATHWMPIPEPPKDVTE